MKSKSFLLIICLAVLAIPLFTGILYSVKQWLHREKMEEKLEASLLQKITIKKTGINWIKKDKEILINHKYFDIISAKDSGCFIIFSGLFDEEEEKLKKQAGLATSGNSPLDKAQAFKLLLLVLYYNSYHEASPLVKGIDGKYLIPDSTGATEGFTILLLQPPRNCS
jgi:hypothetical protein